MTRISNTCIGLSDHHYIALRGLHGWMTSHALPAIRGVLLDYGCGGQPYRSLVEPCIDRYIGADIAAAAGVDLDVRFDPGAPLPLGDATVDTILATQTLEHVYDFDAYLADCIRLLRPGGHLVISVPMQWRQHEAPNDFWRFTRYGLTEKLAEKGFEIGDIQPCGGAYALIGQILLSHLSETGRARPWLTRAINRLCLWLDRRFPDSDETLLWMCVARKPGAMSANPVLEPSSSTLP